MFNSIEFTASRKSGVLTSLTLHSALLLIVALIPLFVDSPYSHTFQLTMVPAVPPPEVIEVPPKPVIVHTVQRLRLPVAITPTEYLRQPDIKPLEVVSRNREPDVAKPSNVSLPPNSALLPEPKREEFRP